MTFQRAVCNLRERSRCFELGACFAASPARSGRNPGSSSRETSSRSTGSAQGRFCVETARGLVLLRATRIMEALDPVTTADLRSRLAVLRALAVEHAIASDQAAQASLDAVIEAASEFIESGDTARGGLETAHAMLTRAIEVLPELSALLATGSDGRAANVLRADMAMASFILARLAPNPAVPLRFGVPARVCTCTRLRRTCDGDCTPSL